ncbi:MAG: hypothetical protein QOG15_2284 [Solirubrobacteraceae bacterium]|nr:hypothetical protein [Solirubrobacteraceae bacterium]
MDLLAAWLLYPLALGVQALGLGLLVGAAAGWRLPGLLIVPVGFAALLALARLITADGSTAQLALPLIVVLALLGLVLGRRRLRELRPDWLIALAVVGVFAVFAAPVVATGTPTFAGYLALPDTSHQLTLADLYPKHGPDWQALRDGSTKLSLSQYATGNYPVAPQAALGVTAPLGGGLDLAWLYQPFMTCLMLAVALCLASLVAPLLRHRWQVAVVAFVAAQSALVVGFALQGSIKEITALALLCVVAAVTAAALLERRPARSLLPIGVAAAGAIGALGPAAVPYLAVPGLVVFTVWGARIARGRDLRELGWLVVGAAVTAGLASPVLSSFQSAVEVNTATLDNSQDLGNLAAPLKLAQALGVWLEGDYRYETFLHSDRQTIALVFVGVAAALGLLWAIRRRAWGPLMFVAMLAITSAYLLRRGNPYADAKVLMILSPALTLLAILGAVTLWTGRWKALSALLVALLGGLFLYSNALAYRDVSYAPYDRYQELLKLNDRLDGRGPVVINEYDEFAKYFLRDVPVYSQPEWPHGYRDAPYKPDALRDPQRRPSLKTPLDTDDLTLKYLESVPFIIVRRSPLASRPPANFRRVSHGRYYDLWQRTSGLRVLVHEPQGRNILKAPPRIDRATARAWGRRATRLHGRIGVLSRTPAPQIRPAAIRHPWPGYPLYPGALVPAAPGRADGPIRVARSGSYRVWIEGSFARRLTLKLDGKVIGLTPRGLNNPGAYASIAVMRVPRGTHAFELSQGAGDRKQPGNRGYLSSLRHVGPIIFEPVGNENVTVTQVAPSRWRRLVGLRSDWLEIIRP